MKNIKNIKKEAGQEIAFKNFVQHCLSLEKAEYLTLFFEVVLTQTEREEFPKRLAILQALLKGDQTQREIAEDLGVSIANITRASNLIKASDLDLKKLLGVEGSIEK